VSGAFERSEAAVQRAQRRVGTVVREKYRVERVLGMGGMACVYLAVHRNGHRVALKVLNPELAVDADVRARFVREAYAANAIDHAGVARVIDDDETPEGEPFLVMELLEGETLQERAKRAGGTLPPREVLGLAYRLLDVVAAAHDKGILHRDLKPDNVFVTKEGIVKVLDFGVARMAIPASGTDPTRTGRTMGTPAFMAPEQAFGKTREVDVRSDVWSVGATMFALLSGRYVHEAENAAQLLVLAATQHARSLAAVAPETPAPVVAIVDRACSFTRDERFPTARAMQAAVADAHRALFGADVSQPLAAVTSPARSVLESAPTLDASSPSMTGASATKHDAGAAAPRPSRAKLVVGVGLAALAVGALGALGLLVRSKGPPTPVSAPAPAAASVARRVPPSAFANADCRVMARPEDVADDATIWIGAMFATTGPMAPEFDGAVRDLEVVLRDFHQETNGLPAARAGGKPRPIGVVACNDAVDPERVARHLVDDVGVPAVVGFSRSKEVVDLATSIFQPRHVAAFASNMAATLSALAPPPGEPRMVWRTTLSAATRVEIQSAIVRDVLEGDLRASGAIKPGEAMRVAFVNYDNSTGLTNADAVVATLRFNGRDVAENGDDFRAFLLTPGDAPNVGPRGATRRLVEELVEMRPHVIILCADASFVPVLEGVWPGGPRPRYVTGPVDAELADRSIAPRVLGVDAATDSPAAMKFELRFNAVFDPKTKPTTTVTGGPYDALYAVAYAIVALGDAPITGTAIARALPRLHGSGPHVDVGPSGIVAATRALAAGGSIDLEGTTTSLDFDPVTGDPTVDYAIHCARAGKDDEAVLYPSGLAWDPRARKVTGTPKCK
jgi:serine/threonine-protein kinase